MKSYNKGKKIIDCVINRNECILNTFKLSIDINFLFFLFNAFFVKY